MKLSARKLREQRRARIDARTKAANKKRKVKAEGEEGGEDELPDWLQEEGEGGDEGGEEMPPAEGEMPPADLPEEPGMPADLPAEGNDDGDEDDLGGDEMGEGDEMPMDLGDEMGEEGTDMESAFNYNPIYQKPTHLGNDKPSGGYHYYGPAPDAGTSYGFFVDSEKGLGLIAPAKAKVFSPATGKAMKLQGKLDTDALASVLASASDMTKVIVGEESRMTSLPLDKVEGPMFDAMTGQQIQIEGPDAAADTDDVPAAENPDDEADAAGMDVPDMPGGGAPMLSNDDEDMDDLGGDEDEGEEEGGEMPPDAEAVDYEALQSVEDFEEEALSENDVHMTLFDEGTPEQPGAEPFWNIDIQGTPVARVYLKDQPKPDEIRQVFCSQDYHTGVAGAIAKVGLAPVLKQIKAHVWANAVEKTKLAKTIKAKVNAEAQQKVVATTKNLMKDLLRCTAVVCAGMDKNFYREEGNPLKEALWAELYAFGITNPAPLIEAAFKKGSTKYFETVLSKAVEYMDLDPKALDQIQKAIGEADVLPASPEGTLGDELPEAIPTPEEAPTLADRLTMSSVAVAGIPALTGDAVGDHKKALRNELRLGGASLRRR